MATSANTPGAGWTNGAVPPQMTVEEGKLQVYQHRRWLGGGWTRIGKGTTELDARHAHSQSLDENNNSSTPEAQSLTFRSLIAQLCETFYRQGWATGTGGGVSVRVRHPETNAWRVFVAPSGIQKEDMIANDVFELDMDRNIVVPPVTPNLRQSACTPLWYVVYRQRPAATAVIHTHSLYAQLATLLDPTEQAQTLKVTHLEMLKGVGNHAYDDVLEIPIIDNRPTEDLLAAQLERALREYPKANAVLVRRHGIYVWGDSWEQAKTQCESFDYLCQSAVELRRMGIDPGTIPTQGTYRVEESSNNDEPPPAKRSKTTATSGFHGLSAASNAADLQSSPIPMVPRDGTIKAIVLDIEGCTTSISFVHDVLFPYARENLEGHLQSLKAQELTTLALALRADVEQHQLSVPPEAAAADASSTTAAVSALVRTLMDADIKSAALKSLQGDIWQSGYARGTLQGHVYDDVWPALQWWQKHQIPVYIYSSGSVAAQKLLFGHSVHGNLLEYLSGHFDIPSSGSKKEAGSYTNIVRALENKGDSKSTIEAASEVLFVSDSEAEIAAAQQAGLTTSLSIRPGNAPLTTATATKTRIHSLLQLCG